MTASTEGQLGDWSDPGRAEEYLSRALPRRGEAESMLLEALPKRVDRFLDLGTGDGRLVSVVRCRHPRAEGVGLDYSAPMLEQGRRRLGSEEGIELRVHDMRECLPDLGAFYLVVSGFAIHHVSHVRKRALFAEIRSALGPGGVFVNLDLVASATPARHERFRRAIGRPEDDPADCLADLCEQLAWLRKAGFVEVECDFKWLEMALMVAVSN